MDRGSVNPAPPETTIMTTHDSLLDYCGTQARVIGDMIEPWKADHERATVAHALESMFPLIVEGCELLRGSLPQLKRNLFDAHHRDESVLVLGSKYHDHYKDYLEHCESLLATARGLVGEGQDISTLAGAEAAVDRLRRFFEVEINRLPRIDPEAIARSTEQYERGEYRSVREVIDELRRQVER
jgi:hypothetical protein